MTNDEVLTGDVTITIYDSEDNPVKNCRCSLYKNTAKLYEGFTNVLGECLIENVRYDAFTLEVTRTGYESSESSLTVDDETVEEEITLTHLPLDPNVVEVDLDEHYLFQVSESTSNPDYRMAKSVSQWLKGNLEGLTDDNDVTIFNKISYGYDAEKLKTFGKKPTADIYIDHVEYDSTMDNCAPVSVHTIIIFYMKGANDVAYLKTTELHDLLMQKFLTDEDWKILSGVVRDTVITNSQLMSQPNNKKWGAMGAFELTHYLYI